MRFQLLKKVLRYGVSFSVDKKYANRFIGNYFMPKVFQANHVAFQTINEFVTKDGLSYNEAVEKFLENNQEDEDFDDKYFTISRNYIEDNFNKYLEKYGSNELLQNKEGRWSVFATKSSKGKGHFLSFLTIENMDDAANFVKNYNAAKMILSSFPGVGVMLTENQFIRIEEMDKNPSKYKEEDKKALWDEILNYNKEMSDENKKIEGYCRVGVNSYVKCVSHTIEEYPDCTVQSLTMHATEKHLFHGIAKWTFVMYKDHPDKVIFYNTHIGDRDFFIVDKLNERMAPKYFKLIFKSGVHLWNLREAIENRFGQEHSKYFFLDPKIREYFNEAVGKEEYDVIINRYIAESLDYGSGFFTPLLDFKKHFMAVYGERNSGKINGKEQLEEELREWIENGKKYKEEGIQVFDGIEVGPYYMSDQENIFKYEKIKNELLSHLESIENDWCENVDHDGLTKNDKEIIENIIELKRKIAKIDSETDLNMINDYVKKCKKLSEFEKNESLISENDNEVVEDRISGYEPVGERKFFGGDIFE